jgi:4'-phosphopantetheinyl transferase
VTSRFAQLISGEVHVWHADLSHVPESFDRLTRVLSDSEAERATRFHFLRDATRWVMSRVILRSILGKYLDIGPQAVGFRAGRWGKPELAPPFERDRLEFNTSHSDALGLYAVAASRRVGVDIERLQSLPDLEAIAERMFSPAERQALGALPQADRLVAFFSCWTRKEAYIKALGAGFAYPLERFTVSLNPDAPARLEDVQDHPAEVDRWSLSELPAPPGYAAALAIEGRPAKLLVGEWQEPAF